MSDSGAATLGEVEVIVRANLGPYEQDISKAKEAAKGLGHEANKAGHAAAEGMNHANEKAKQFHESMNVAREAAMLMGAALSVEKIIEWTDQWAVLNKRLENVTGSSEGAKQALEALTTSVTGSRDSLLGTADAFLRNEAVMSSLGYTLKQQIDYQEALNAATEISGASQERAAAVGAALTRAMNQGSLSGIALRSVMSSSSEVAKLLAKQLNVSVSSLFDMAKQGKITSDVIGKALLGNLDDLRERAEKMPETFEKAGGAVKNALFVMVGKLDEAAGASDGLSRFIEKLADGLLNAAVPAANLLKGAIAGLKDQFKSLPEGAQDAIKFFGTFAGATVGVLALASAIGGPLVAAFNVLKGVMLGNPLFMIVAAVAGALIAIWNFRDQIKKVFGIDVADIFKTATNAVIRGILSGWEILKTFFSNAPDLIGAAIIGSVNLIIGAINNMVSAATEGINHLIDLANTAVHAVNDALPKKNIQHNIYPQGSKAYDLFEEQSGNNAIRAGQTDRLGTIGYATAPKIAPVANPYAASAAQSGDALNNKLATINTTDYVGNLSGVAKGAEKAAGAVDKLTGAVTGLHGKMLDPKLQKILTDTDAYIAKVKAQTQAVGLTAQAAAELTHYTDLYNQAVATGLKLDPKYIANLHAKAAAMAMADEQAAKASEAFGFAKDAFRGFFDDMKGGLQSGKSAWESFTNAITNLLDKIVNKLEDQVLNALFDVNNAAKGGGQGGFLGGLVKMAAGLIGAAAGAPAAGVPFAQATGFNLATATSFHKGGIVGQGGLQRVVPSSIFDNAPKFHAGGEVPAILEAGETVIPKHGRGGNNAPPNIAFNVQNNGDPVRLRERGPAQFDGRKWVVDLVLDTLGNGKADGPMKRYGGKPQVAGRG